MRSHYKALGVLLFPRHFAWHAGRHPVYLGRDRRKQRFSRGTQSQTSRKPKYATNQPYRLTGAAVQPVILWPRPAPFPLSELSTSLWLRISCKHFLVMSLYPVTCRKSAGRHRTPTAVASSATLTNRRVLLSFSTFLKALPHMSLTSTVESTVPAASQPPSSAGN